MDIAQAAVEKARLRAQEEAVTVNFLVDDLTSLRHVSGTFDFLLDYGFLDDLRPRHRHSYRRTVLTLAHPGTQYFLWGWEYPARWWERILAFFGMPFRAGEIEHLFGDYFDIERIAGRIDFTKRPPGYAAYLMTRK